MVINNNYSNRINRIGSNNTAVTKKPTLDNSGGFGALLQETIKKNEGVKFSKHAEVRLQTRNIKLTQAQTDKISEAVTKADGKGVRDTLVMMDGMAFVVNVPSRTVITAVNSSELKDNVFTNIDGAVIV
jgi:flagellar operon protein